MESKKCCKCKEVKQIDCFSKDKRNNDGYQYRCKSCHKKWRQENKERIKQRGKKYYQENKERIKHYCKEYNQENKERIKHYCKEYNQENKERIKQYYKEYNQENKERIKQHYEENKERINERRKQRKLTDPLYRLTHNLRSRTTHVFKRKSYRKTSKTAEMLGVPYEIAFAHIERQFTKGMTWENQGEWHIDHIIPLASAETESELRKLCHYTNLQPLWAFDNISKSDNLIDGTQVKLRL